MLEKFAGYGFNRSHSAAYAWVSYQTAYLKANFPVEFMAAVMSNEVANTDKISIFVGECERMGIPHPGAGREPLVAEVCAGEGRRSAEGIRYGLAAIKNVGEGAMQSASRSAPRRRLHVTGEFLLTHRYAQGEQEDAGIAGEMRRV